MISRNRVLSGLSVSLLCALLAVTWFAAGTRGQRSDPGTDVRWEYLIVGPPALLTASGASPGERKQNVFGNEASVVQRGLDALGKDGWDLVSIGGNLNQPTFYLKRPSQRRQ